jgi:hypothetical protein
MIEPFIKIRLKQFYRGIAGIGLIRVIFLIGIIGFITALLFVKTSKTPDSYYSAVVFLSIVGAIHFKRQDKEFLKCHFNNYRLICFVEYLLLLVPILSFLLYHHQTIVAGTIIIAMGVLINFDVKPRQRSINTSLQRLIPYNCFEWKAGVRKNLYLIVTIWIVGLCTPFFIGSAPVVIFVLGIFSINFYETGEPIQMIMAFEKGTNKFIFYKLKMQFILFSILTIPLIIGFMIFHFERWYIPIFEYLIFLSLHIYVILVKYAFYEPNIKPVGAQLINAVGLFFAMIPFLIPVLWLLSIRFYLKAYENLNFYLNDYN